jgi:hypothetical protein
MAERFHTTGPLREAWRGVMDDYAQTWKWIRRPVTRPPTGAFFVFGSLLAASASFLLLGVRL